MAIVGNTASEIGDVMIMVTDIPIRGIVSITGFTDSIVGETGSRFFDKQFRYSLDGGLNWNEEGYQALTAPILAAVPIDPTYDCIFEFRYERAGTDDTGLLEWNNTQLTTTNNPIECGPAFQDSIFSFFFASCYHPDVINWCLNVTEKMYRPGILPVYVERGDNQNINQDDRDFIDLWRSVSCYFALLVGYARGFENFRYNQQLLVSFLRQRGVYVCDNASITDLQYIQENYWDEMRHRGTILISKKKGELINGVAKPVAGELLRLICYNDDCDEFLFEISEFDTIGWVVDDWSPLYQGTTHRVQINKLYEKSIGVQDINNYPIINDTYVSQITDGSISLDVIEISAVPAGEVAGIGIAAGAYDEDFATNIDPETPYELSFLVEVEDTGNGVPPLTVQGYTFTQPGTPVSLQDISDGLLPDSDVMLDKVVLNEGQYYKVSIIIYPYTQLYSADDNQRLTNLNTGNNSRIKSDTVCKFIPYIILDNSAAGLSSGDMRIYNLRFAPASTEYSTGFIETADFIQTWIKNNQGDLSQDDVTEIIDYYLIPYSSSSYNNYL